MAIIEVDVESTEQYTDPYGETGNNVSSVKESQPHCYTFSSRSLPTLQHDNFEEALEGYKNLILRQSDLCGSSKTYLFLSPVRHLDDEAEFWSHRYDQLCELFQPVTTDVEALRAFLYTHSETDQYVELNCNKDYCEDWSTLESFFRHPDTQLFDIIKVTSAETGEDDFVYLQSNEQKKHSPNNPRLSPDPYGSHRSDFTHDKGITGSGVHRKTKTDPCIKGSRLSRICRGLVISRAV